MFTEAGVAPFIWPIIILLVLAAGIAVWMRSRSRSRR